MNTNNQTSQGYSDLPIYQTGNNFAPSHFLDNNNNDQRTSINNVGMSNTFIINTITPTLQNDTFEFYFPLHDNDTRIYYITYTELHPLEIAQFLNNRVNLSCIPDHQLPQHYNIQSLIRQQIQQQVQQPVYQQNSVQQQSFDTIIQPTQQSQFPQQIQLQQSQFPQQIQSQQSQSPQQIQSQQTYQVYSDNNNAYNNSLNSVNGTISDNIQDTRFQNSS
ncbi:unnamed protein product [Rhizophagus irregularis]|uniref:Uncharacterized protein n=1 Tax=Rhizophagus irregularis TaxID=588596 RepID=A0A2N1MS02_9GLOM|nr:hypothetical protein RhiirC2_787518 [Rhizophagus irregularis]CAB4391429.1 unnamed protein product [Rhizophagus irregularis]CAB5390883.1 unnamed protein product [Rhizophagus irregularis]